MNVQELLLLLQEIQSKGSNGYPRGIFPSQRFQPKLDIVREDDNVFFTACIVHILQDLVHKLDSNEQAIAQQICTSAIAAYPLYKNKDGRDTYNFWKTKPSGHFPNGNWMHRYDHFRIPDDIDDTALIFFTENASKERVGLLRETLKKHANLSYQQAKNPPKNYRNLKVYSTFIGKKMYIEFDVCALSNLMRLILKHFPNELNEYDWDTLQFIYDVVQKEEYERIPFQVAPQYTTAPIILYHLARLLPYLPPEYSLIQSKVMTSLQSWWEKLPIGMEKLMLENELLKQNGSMAPTGVYTRDVTKNKDFFYFIAGLLTAYEGGQLQKIAESPWTHLRYRSEAFNLTLLLENAVLRRNLLPTQPMA